MHLQHLIPWSELIPCLQVDPTQICLPVGECGRIHVNDKATEIKVQRRKFLKPKDICTDKDCKTLDVPGQFSKNKLSPPTLQTRRPTKDIEVKKKLKFFREKFCKAIWEFVETEEKKYTDEIIKNFKPIGPAAVVDTECTECYSYPCRYNCEGFKVFSLYTNYEIEHLLWLDSRKEVSVGDALYKLYGGQAVGNGYQFLVIYHLLPFYITANAIIACGYESCEEKWGILSTVNKPWGFMRSLSSDCDFKTFIPSLRPYLHKDVFMRDMTKTMELLREVFRHIYVYFYLKKRFCSYTEERLRDEVRWPILSCLGFSFDYDRE